MAPLLPNTTPHTKSSSVTHGNQNGSSTKVWNGPAHRCACVTSSGQRHMAAVRANRSSRMNSWGVLYSLKSDRYSSIKTSGTCVTVPM
jgi:hypothetical protein